MRRGMAEDKNTAAANSLVTKAEFNRLLAAMEGVQEQIHTMLSAEREAADKRLAKKIWLDRSMVFKKKMHEKQFCFNEDVREKISPAANSLDSTPPAVERAKEALREGEWLLVARQKAITYRIADQSEYGWGPTTSNAGSVSSQQSSSSLSGSILVVHGLGPCFLCGKTGQFRRSCPLFCHKLCLSNWEMLDLHNVC